MTTPASETAVDAVVGGVPIRERYGLVLFLIFLGYVFSGIEQSRFLIAVNSLLWIALLLTTLWSPGVPRRLRWIGLVATILVLMTTLSLGLISSELADGWRLILLGIAQLAALLAILNRVSRHRKVTFQTVMGGVAAYALIAFVMAALFHGIDLLTDTTFLNGVVANGDYVYFSFVTLTTVGYGDITAATDVAKRLVVVEAFVGQVFLVALVARLVSLWGAPERK
jgi:voltage-gated potassium channel Kch